VIAGIFSSPILSRMGLFSLWPVPDFDLDLVLVVFS